MKPRDLLKVEVLGEPRLSPDGKSAVYTATRLDIDQDRYVSDLCTVPVSGGNPRVLMRGGAGRIQRPVWSPDGRAVAFLWNVSGTLQVWRLDLDAGDPVQVTHGGIVTDLCWSPDSRSLAYCAYGTGVTPGAPRIREYTRFPVKYDGLGLLEDEGPALYVTAAGGGAPELIDGGPYTHAAPAFSPDGRWLACARVEHFNVYARGGGEVWVFPTGGGAGRAVAGSVGFHQGVGLAWCQDSRHLIYVSSHMQVSGTKSELVRVGLDGGEPVRLTKAFDRFVGHGVGSDLRFGAGPMPVAADATHAYFCAGDGGDTPLFRVALSDTGPVEQVTPAARHCVAEFSLGPNRSIVYTAMDDLHLDQLYHLDDSGRVVLLDTRGAELWGSLGLPPMERFEVEGPGGLTAEGWVCLPPQHAGPVPAILHIHGGPHAQWGHALEFRHALWQAQGWAVILLNPPGSGGYGVEFARAVHEDWGGKDYHFQMAAVDHCIARGWVQEAHLAVTGTSYGGFMTNTVITRTDRFCCAITENGLSNLYSSLGTSDYGILLSQVHFRGMAPWEGAEAYLARSPVHHAHCIHTPLLINHCEGDSRVSISQGEELYTALHRLGREAVFVRYPHDSHFMSWSGRPSNRIHLLERNLRWFRSHLVEGK